MIQQALSELPWLWAELSKKPSPPASGGPRSTTPAAPIGIGRVELRARIARALKLYPNVPDEHILDLYKAAQYELSRNVTGLTFKCPQCRRRQSIQAAEAGHVACENCGVESHVREWTGVSALDAEAMTVVELHTVFGSGVKFETFRSWFKGMDYCGKRASGGAKLYRPADALQMLSSGGILRW